MNTYQKSLIEEHSQLVIRINELNNHVYSEEASLENRIEFANECIQLSSMKKYEECLRARLENANIIFENGQYFERVASISSVIVPPVVSNDSAGSDFDKDTENQNIKQ